MFRHLLFCVTLIAVITTSSLVTCELEDLRGFDGSFDAALTKSTDKSVIILWKDLQCSFCRQFRPEFHEVADVVEDTPELADSFIVGQVEVGANMELADQFRITAYPTLTFHTAKTRQVIRYSGELNARAILQFMVAQHSSSAKAEKPRAEEEEVKVE